MTPAFLALRNAAVQCRERSEARRAIFERSDRHFSRRALSKALALWRANLRVGSAEAKISDALSTPPPYSKTGSAIAFWRRKCLLNGWALLFRRWQIAAAGRVLAHRQATRRKRDTFFTWMEVTPFFTFLDNHFRGKHGFLCSVVVFAELSRLLCFSSL